MREQWRETSTTTYFIGEAPPMQMIKPQRWTCTYCKGLRLGDSCEGCGAPRNDTPTAPIIPRQPRDTIK